MRCLIISISLLLGSSTPLLAQSPATKTDGSSTPVDPGVAVYRKVLHSTVWVHSERGHGKLATGSGSLVDKGRRLVLTNYHVVGDVKKALVYFPDYSADHKLIPERKHYLDRTERLGIPGEVVEIDKEGDLALIRIDRVPEGATELPIAEVSPEPGQTVHSVGNPGRSGALWVYTPGKVRQVYNKKWQVKLDEKTVQTFQAKVIETDSPTNPGDSGGPLVNDRGELVGVTQGGAIDAQSLSIFVDLAEVKRLLNRRAVQVLRSTEVAVATQAAKEPAKARRETALKSVDDAKIFSEDAWKKVQPAADKLLKEKNLDLLIEARGTLPKEDVEKFKAMTGAEREKYFKDFARERCKTEKLDGIYIIICKSPGFIYVEITNLEAFPSAFGSKLTNVILTAFKDKKFDAGLTEGLQMILDLKGLGEKK